MKQSEPELERTGKREERNNAKEKYKGKEDGSKTMFQQKVSKLNLSAVINELGGFLRSPRLTTCCIFLNFVIHTKANKL